MEMNQQKIDFLINDEVLNTMASDFQYNEQTIRLDYGYKYRRKNYVKNRRNASHINKYIVM